MSIKGCVGLDPRRKPTFDFASQSETSLVETAGRISLLRNAQRQTRRHCWISGPHQRSFLLCWFKCGHANPNRERSRLSERN